MTAVRPRPDASSAPITQQRSPAARAVGLLVLLVALGLAVIASLAVGARSIPPLEVLQILLGDRGGQNAVVVAQLRVPRTLIAIVAGAALGVAGALIQAVTRNPLADPGILGVNAGAAFALALGTGLLGISGTLGTLTLAYVGAFAASLLVYAIGSLGRGGASPVRLILAGVALGAVLAGVTRAIVLTDRERFAGMTAWESGSLLDRDAGLLTLAAPLTLLGLGIALAIGSSLNAIALGDDLASALGANVFRTRVLAVTAVMLLAGTATALAGPISFVGLMVPHAVRWIVGPDQRWIIGYSVVAAPTLLLLADVLGRVVIAPAELPAGIVTALIGAPVLIFLVRQRKASEL
ncbi:MAG: iron chelate uptake ABC transporter family permease subunit [Micropruina sp.]|uniref:FecCD family ABC transporter permease n=1 Tax=Micropruina sp. TaxID=2737536 RepID=UPI0039E2F5A1